MKHNTISLFDPFLFIAICVMAFAANTFAQVETPTLRLVVPEINQNDEELDLRMIPKCETEERLKKKYEEFSVDELIEELQTADSVFMCWGVRSTQRLASKRWVIQWALAERRDEAVAQLIKLVKKGKPEFSVIALELIQHADQNLLKEHRNLFIKKSTSENIIERNRSLHILQRIKDEHIENVIIKRWNALSNRELEHYANTGTFELMAQLIIYQVQNRTLVEESTLLTLRTKKLSSRALTEYCQLIRALVYNEHSTEIEEEIVQILLKTNDPNVANYAAEVLKDARTIEARNGLIHCLDIKKDSVRAEVARHLLARYDFDLVKDRELLQRLLSDESEYVLNRLYGPLTWKSPNNEQSASIVQCLLNDLSESKRTMHIKAMLFVRYYSALDQKTSKELTINHLPSVLEAIETAIHSNDYGRLTKMTTEELFKKLNDQKEMDISHLEFWRMQLER